MSARSPLLLGAVLAGGAARRFGSDKAWAMWQGRPLIGHAVDRLSGHADTIVTCGRRFGDLPALDDRPSPGLGPLGGLLAALRYGEAHGYAAVVTIACDTPVIPDILFRMLIARPPAWCADAPVLGCWPVALADRLERFVTQDTRRSLRGWAAETGAIAIASPCPIANVNTPEDLAAL